VKPLPGAHTCTQATTLGLIATRHGGSLVATEREATHVVTLDESSEGAQRDPSESKLRVLARRDGQALVHWWYVSFGFVGNWCDCFVGFILLGDWRVPRRATTTDVACVAMTHGYRRVKCTTCLCTLARTARRGV
jgi:hypothetical protein